MRRDLAQLEDALTPVVPTPIYLDVSVLGRLSDTLPMLADEIAQAKLIAEACAAGKLRLITSEILAYEVANGPTPYRARSESVLAHASASIPIIQTLQQAARLNTLGLPLLDALHVAAAVVGGARYAVSCDHHWLRNAIRVAARFGTQPAIVSPAELVHREGL